MQLFAEVSGLRATSRSLHGGELRLCHEALRNFTDHDRGVRTVQSELQQEELRRF
jgi:hypothetical protein